MPDQADIRTPEKFCKQFELERALNSVTGEGRSPGPQKIVNALGSGHYPCVLHRLVCSYTCNYLPHHESVQTQCFYLLHCDSRRVLSAGSGSIGANAGARARRARTASSSESETAARSGCSRTVADQRRISKTRPDAHGSRFQFYFWQCRYRRRRAGNQRSVGAGLAERLFHGLASSPLRRVTTVSAERCEQD